MHITSGISEVPLREICFDYAAGVLDKPAFHAAVEAWLRHRTGSDEVLIQCGEQAPGVHMDELERAGWYRETVEGRQLLHAAVAFNGRVAGVLSCIREAGAAPWTVADGVSLRRYATTLASHFGKPSCMNRV